MDAECGESGVEKKRACREEGEGEGMAGPEVELEVELEVAAHDGRMTAAAERRRW